MQVGDDEEKTAVAMSMEILAKDTVQGDQITINKAFVSCKLKSVRPALTCLCPDAIDAGERAAGVAVQSLHKCYNRDKPSRPAWPAHVQTLQEGEPKMLPGSTYSCTGKTALVSSAPAMIAGARSTHKRTRMTALVCVQNVHMCECCGKVQRKMLLCSKCKHCWYCSAACQKAAWPMHKRECSTLSKAFEAVTSTELFEGQTSRTLYRAHLAMVMRVRLCNYRSTGNVWQTTLNNVLSFDHAQLQK